MSIGIGVRRWACLLAAAATLVIGAGCGVEFASGPGYDDAYPPDVYIATTEPFYFEGRPTYWYGGRWYYRDGSHWRHFDREPPALYQRRMQGPPVRRSYEPPRARPRGVPGGGHFEHGRRRATRRKDGPMETLLGVGIRPGLRPRGVASRPLGPSSGFARSAPKRPWKPQEVGMTTGREYCITCLAT
jgi:hypothetical protein